MSLRTRFCDAIPAAICDGDFLYVKFCVEEGANINAKDLRYGFSFLHWAIVYGKLEIAKFLLQDHRFQNGANINAKDNNGLSPLHNAIFCDPNHIVKYSKKDEERAEKEARKKNEENVKKRTENEARKKAEENIKKRSEEEAWIKDQEKAEKEANISNSNDILAENNSVEIVKFLLRNGADINAKDKNGWNPLHRAIWFGKIEIVRVLIQNGAKINAKDNHGWSPLDLAAYCGHWLIVKYLEKAEEYFKKKAEEEILKKAEEIARKRAEEDARRKAEEARKRAEEEARKKYEEAR